MSDVALATTLEYAGRVQLGVMRVSSTLVAAGRMNLTHVDGDLYRLTPTEHFDVVPSGHLIACHVYTTCELRAHSDVYPNWYVTASRAQPRLMVFTQGDSMSFIGKFDNNFSDSGQYADNAKLKDLGPGTLKRLLPTPKIVHYKKPALILKIDRNTWTVVANRKLRFEALYLADKLGIAVNTIRQTPHYIKLDLVGELTNTSAEEAYEISMTLSYVTIKASTAAGIFYGIQTFLNLGDTSLLEFPVVSIKDEPRYPYRAVLLDVSANFLRKEELYRILDMMAMYKLNTLQLLLSDSHAWRLVIEPPQHMVTQTCSCRQHNRTECMHPSVGSGPFANTSGSGYFSKNDYEDILRYAHRRHVTVVPVIDFLSAPTARYFQDDVPLNLSYQPLTSQGGCIQHTLDPCRNHTHQFIDSVMSAIADMHTGIDALRYVHVGAMAEADYSKLPESCGNHSDKRTGTSVKENFVNDMARIAVHLQTRLIGDAESFHDDTHVFQRRHSDTYVYIRDAQRVDELTGAEYKIIIGDESRLFFDHRQSTHPADHGRYYATDAIDIASVFNYKPEELLSSSRQHIYGMQATVWSDTIRSASRMQQMLFPRLLAFAERSWHCAVWEETESSRQNQKELQHLDWQEFANSLGYHELARLERAGVKYHLPAPGVSVDPDGVHVNVALPGLPVMYSMDNGRHWYDWLHGMKPTGKISFATRSHDRRRRSRSVNILIDRMAH